MASESCTTAEFLIVSSAGIFCLKIKQQKICVPILVLNKMFKLSLFVFNNPVNVTSTTRGPEPALNYNSPIHFISIEGIRFEVGLLSSAATERVLSVAHCSI